MAGHAKNVALSAIPQSNGSRKRPDQPAFRAVLMSGRRDGWGDEDYASPVWPRRIMGQAD
jgi:hypothetical protein